MEDLTIKLGENNIHIYLMKMQDMRDEIDLLQKDKIKYNKQQFLTLTFDNMGKTDGDFLAIVKCQRS